MKRIKKNIVLKKILFLYILVLSINGFTQTENSFFTIGLKNVTASENTIEMDVTITIDSNKELTKLAQISVGINYNSDILNNGNPCKIKNCGSWTYIGGKSDAISRLKTTINTSNTSNGHLRIVGTPLNYDSSIVIPNGTYILGRYRFVNSVSWTKKSNAQLWLQPNNKENKTNTIISTYQNNKSRKLVANTTSIHANSKLVSLQYTFDSPLNIMLNTKNNFNLVAAPNPYSENFHFNVQTSSESAIQIKVYDMLGKLIDNENIEYSEIQNSTFGSNYPSGVYIINVSQGENTQTLRVIKK